MSTSFSATCSRLSQYLKHNGGGSLADLHIRPQPPIETLDLFPCPSSSETNRCSKPGGKSQLTILYGGKVLTFDDFPADKAGDLMSMAGGGGGATSSAAMAGGLPIARRRSLHLFLQKRKDRINSKAPYQLNGSSSKDDDVSSASEKPWLGLDLNAVPT